VLAAVSANQRGCDANFSRRESDDREFCALPCAAGDPRRRQIAAPDSREWPSAPARRPGGPFHSDTQEHARNGECAAHRQAGDRFSPPGVAPRPRPVRARRACNGRSRPPPTGPGRIAWLGASPRSDWRRQAPRAKPVRRATPRLRCRRPRSSATLGVASRMRACMQPVWAHCRSEPADPRAPARRIRDSF
jgi:hypothetical protein